MRRIAILAAAAVLAAAPAEAQKAKDTLRFPLSDFSEAALDPYLQPGVFINSWESAIWDNVLGFDPEKSAFTPLLAKSWSQPDATTYEFELRDDVVWHDGQAFDADDVVYTLSYLTDPKVNLRYKANWAWIASVEKLGSYKVRLKSKQPVPDGLTWMAFNTTIYPEHVHGPLADKQGYGAAPVGTGPLKILKIDRNAGIVAEKNKAFKAGRGKDAAGVGRVVAEPVPDSGTLVAKLLRGEIDVARDPPGDQAVALRDSGRFDFALSPPALGYTYITFPTKGAQAAPALADPRVRLAVIKAINRPQVIEVRYGEPGKSLVAPEFLCAKEQLGCGYTKVTPEFDPAGARKLLAEAGYADGFDVSIATQSIPEATAVAGMLRVVGIRATVRLVTLAQRLQMLNQGKIEIGYYGYSGGGMFEVSPALVRYFLSNEYEDGELAKMATDALPMMDDAARRAAVAKIMDLAHERAYAFPIVPIRVIFVHTKEVKLKATGVRAGQVNPHEFGWK